jgi:hypothetical protein
MPLAQQENLLRRELSKLGEESGESAFRQRQIAGQFGRASNAAETDKLQMQLPAMGGGAPGRDGLPAPSAQPGAGGAKQGDGAQPTKAFPIRRVGERAFFLRDGKWVDSQIGEQVPDKVQKVERFSDEYFKLIEKHQDLLGSMTEVDEPILVKIGSIVYQL